MYKFIKNESSTETYTNLYPNLNLFTINSQTPTMSLEINTLLKLIPTFDTTQPQQIYRFIRSCESAFKLANENQIHILLVYALNNITGSSASDIHCKQYDTWYELKSFLIEKFANVKTISHLNLELQSMFQKPGESLVDYFHRVDLNRSKLIEKLNTEINDKTIYGRIATAEETALSVFINGLNSEIGTMLRTKGFSNLNEAGQFAIQEDKIRAMNATRQLMFKVNTSNNTTNSRSIQRPPISKPPYQHYKQSSYSQNTLTPQSVTKVCSYCKKIGHLISDCRKRIYNNSIRTNQYPQPEQRAIMAPPARINNLNSEATSEQSSALETALESCSMTQIPTLQSNIENLQY